MVILSFCTEAFLTLHYNMTARKEKRLFLHYGFFRAIQSAVTHSLLYKFINDNAEIFSTVSDHSDVHHAWAKLTTPEPSHPLGPSDALPDDTLRRSAHSHHTRTTSQTLGARFRSASTSTPLVNKRFSQNTWMKLLGATSVLSQLHTHSPHAQHY